MADLTLGLLAHGESVLLGPTLRSIEAALAPLHAESVETELILGLDRPTEATRAFVDQSRFDAWDRHDFDFADQGQARNAIAEMARGRFLGFLDADDLYSENWFIEALRVLRAADAAGEKRIARPEINWLFDGGKSVLAVPSQTDPWYLPEYLLVSNPFDALCMGPVEAWRAHPYARRAVQEGYAYEDWQWALETTAAGWVHVTVPDTIIFKRRRDQSQTVTASAANVLVRQVAGTAIDEAALLRPFHAVSDREH